MKVIKNVSEERKIDRGSLRTLCIRNNWCNACSNEEYEELLSYCSNCKATPEDIATIAATIDEYTTDSYYNGEVCSIAFEIVRNCCFSTFEIVD